MFLPSVSFDPFEGGVGGKWKRVGEAWKGFVFFVYCCMGRKINQQIDWMGLVDEFKGEKQPNLPAYSRNLKEFTFGGDGESFDPEEESTPYSMNPGDFSMDMDVETPDAWSDSSFGVPEFSAQQDAQFAQGGLELFTKAGRNARKFSKWFDNIVKKTDLKGSTRKNSPLYSTPPNIPVSGINFQQYQAQQKLLADDWLKNLQLKNRPLTALPPSSNILDYHPIHRTDKEIFPEKAWWTPGADWAGPHSEQVFKKVTLKDGTTRLRTQREIDGLPITKEELKIQEQNAWKLSASQQPFLKSDIISISSEPYGNPLALEYENTNVQRGFVPDMNVVPHNYPRDIAIDNNISFPWNITDPYTSNIPSNVSPKGLATSLFDQASAEGLFKPGFQSWREEMIKENFVRDHISGELSSKDNSGSLKEYINTELGDLDRPFLEGLKGSTGYIGTSRIGIERLHEMMINTGYNKYTGAQFNEMFPNEKSLSPDAVVTFDEVTNLLRRVREEENLGETIIPYGTSSNYNKMKFLFDPKTQPNVDLPSLGNPPYDAQNYRFFQEGGSWDTIPPMIQDNTIVPLPNKLEIIEEDKPKLLDLNNIMNYIIETRGGDIDLWSGAADSIAYHESSASQRMDPKAVQVSGNEETGFYDGPGRGMFQFEPSSLKTAQARYKNIADVTDFNIDQNILDVTDARDLSKKQQYTLFFANLIESDAVLKDFADGKLSLEDLWLQGHKNKETEGNRESFRASIEDAKNKGIKSGYSDFTLEELLSEKEGGELPKAQFGKLLKRGLKAYKDWKPNIPFYNYTPYSGVKGDKIWNPYFNEWEKSQKISALDQTKNQFLKEVEDTKNINILLKGEKQRINEPTSKDQFSALFDMSNKEKGLNPSVFDEIELLQNIKGSMLPAFDTYLEAINAGKIYDRSMIELYKSLPLSQRIAPGLFPLTKSVHFDRLDKSWSYANEQVGSSGPYKMNTYEWDPRMQIRKDFDSKYLEYLDRRMENVLMGMKPPKPGSDFDIDLKNAMKEYNVPLPGAPQPKFQPFVNPQYYTDLEKYYIGKHGTGLGQDLDNFRGYPSDRLWLNAHNFKSGLQSMAYEMWLNSSRRNPLGITSKLPTDNLSRFKLSSNLDWTDRLYSPRNVIRPSSMPNTPLRSTFINERNLPWNLNEKGGELEKAQEGQEGKYHYSSYDPNASNWGNTIAKAIIPQSIGDFAMTPFLMGSKVAKAAYTGGKSLYDKWFSPEAQEGTEIEGDSPPYYIEDAKTSSNRYVFSSDNPDEWDIDDHKYFDRLKQEKIDLLKPGFDFMKDWTNSKAHNTMLKESVDENPSMLNTYFGYNFEDADEMQKHRARNLGNWKDREFRFHTSSDDYKPGIAASQGWDGVTNISGNFRRSNIDSSGRNLWDSEPDYINQKTGEKNYPDYKTYKAARLKWGQDREFEGEGFQYKTMSDHACDGTGCHEFSHASDMDRTFQVNPFRSDYIIPEADVQLMENSLSSNYDENDKRHKYLKKPTETRARLNEIRKVALDNNLWDVMNKKPTKEEFNKLKELTEEKKHKNFFWNSGLGDLQEIYDDDKIFNLLRDVSDASDEIGDDLPEGAMRVKHGGEPINDSFYSRDKYTSNASKYRRA